MRAFFCYLFVLKIIFLSFFASSIGFSACQTFLTTASPAAPACIMSFACWRKSDSVVFMPPATTTLHRPADFSAHFNSAALLPYFIFMRFFFYLLKLLQHLCLVLTTYINCISYC